MQLLENNSYFNTAKHKHFKLLNYFNLLNFKLNSIGYAYTVYGVINLCILIAATSL